MQARRFQPKAAYGASVVIAMCAAATLFMGEFRVAAMMACQAGLAFCLSLNAAKKAGRKAIDG